MDFAELQQTAEYRRLLEGTGEIRVQRMLEMPKHILSHRVIYARFYELEVSRFGENMNFYLQAGEEEVEKYAVSRLIELYRERKNILR